MAAPSGTVWGSTVGSYGKIGIYRSVSSSGSSSTVTVSTWFWSKYSVSDSGNSYYYNRGATSATTLIGSVSISTSVASGSGWSTSNQVKLGSYSYTYTRGTSAQTVNVAAKLKDIDRVGGTMTATTSFTIPKLDSYTVSYNANGGSGAPSSQTKWYGKTLTLSSTKPTRTGYTFAGWATSSSGSVAYAAGASYTANAAVTLYAKWTAITYTVSYNANGGSGAPSNQTKTYGVSLTLSSTKPTRTSYTFKGWATSASGSVAYAAGESYTANAAVTLYAVWELTYTLPDIKDLKAIRCNSDGTADETGSYSLVTFSWSTCTVSDNEATLSSCEIVCNGVTTTVSVSGSSGLVSSVVGAGALSADLSYDITVTLTDSKSGVTTKTITLPTSKFIVDFKAGGTGMAIGKVADTDNLLDVALPSVFDDGSMRLEIGGGRYYALNTSGDCGFRHIHNTTNSIVAFGVGSGGYNRGIYDYTGENWLVYANQAGNTIIPNTPIVGGHSTAIGSILSASTNTSKTLSADTTYNLVQISLPVGTWVVSGSYSSTMSANTKYSISISTASATNQPICEFYTYNTGTANHMTAARVFNCSSATTVYLVGYGYEQHTLNNAYMFAVRVA